ncbi:MAG TPA: lipocalin-like domain-containing protein [Chitinophagaceae bacterium]|nr:lipocalin-like domain-containing protein [Chitinophagaceae bacterium]
MKSYTVFYFAILLSSCTSKQQTDINSQLAGMYKLHSIEVQDSAGVYHHDPSSDGTGYIVYDGKGHMAVHITPKEYKEYQWVLPENESLYPEKVKEKMDGMSIDELKAALGEFVSNYVYVANYSVSDSSNIITHERLSHTIPSSWNTTVKRRFIFRGDTLELHNDVAKRKLIWIKQK